MRYAGVLGCSYNLQAAISNHSHNHLLTLGLTNPFLGRPAATSGLPIKPYLHQPEGGVGNHQRKGKENLDKDKKMKVIAFLS